MPALLDLVDRGVERGEVERDGLLAEGRHAGPRRQQQHRHVGRRRRRDHEGVDAAGHELAGRRGDGDAELVREAARERFVGVAHGDRPDPGERDQRARVEGPDPAGADEPDAEGGRPRVAGSGLHQ